MSTFFIDTQVCIMIEFTVNTINDKYFFLYYVLFFDFIKENIFHSFIQFLKEEKITSCILSV